MNPYTLGKAYNHALDQPLISNNPCIETALVLKMKRTDDMPETLTSERLRAMAISTAT